MKRNDYFWDLLISLEILTVEFPFLYFSLTKTYSYFNNDLNIG